MNAAQAPSQRASEHASFLRHIEQRLASVHGFAESTAKAAVFEFIRCLQLKAKDATPPTLSMPVKVDMAWHEAILCTDEYAKLCERLLGQGALVAHTTRTVEDAEEEKAKRVDAMAGEYEMHYGEEPKYGSASSENVWTASSASSSAIGQQQKATPSDAGSDVSPVESPGELPRRTTSSLVLGGNASKRSCESTPAAEPHAKRRPLWTGRPLPDENIRSSSGSASVELRDRTEAKASDELSVDRPAKRKSSVSARARIAALSMKAVDADETGAYKGSSPEKSSVVPSVRTLSAEARRLDSASRKLTKDDKRFNVKVRDQDGTTIQFLLGPSTSVGKILEAYSKKIQVPSYDIKFLFNAVRLNLGDTFGGLEMENMDCIDAIITQYGC